MILGIPNNSKTDTAYSKLTVPYSLLEYAVKNKRFTSVQIFIAAKFLFGSKFNEGDLKELANMLKFNIKTIRHHIHLLVSQGWIGHDNQGGIYFIRNFKFIRIVLNDNTRAGYHLLFRQLGDFKAFAIASTYDRLIGGQQTKKWEQNRESRKKGSSLQIGNLSKGFYPVANTAYAKCFGVSEATASRYRELAYQTGFMMVIPVKIKTNYPTSDRLIAPYFRKEFGIHLVYLKGRYYRQEISKVRSNLIRKRINTLIPLWKKLNGY